MTRRLIALLLVIVSTASARTQNQGKPYELANLRLPGLFTSMPEPLKKATLTYPPNSSIAGTVEIEIGVSSSGAVIDARVAKSLDAAVNEECRAAAERWTFAPAVAHPGNVSSQGTPVPALVLLRFEFVAPRGNEPGQVSTTLTTVPDRADLAQMPANAVTPSPSQTALKLPTPLRNVTPSYTEAAMRARVQGDVEIMAIVMPDGTIGVARVVKSLDVGLDQEALRVARHWLFKPGTLDGAPVPVIITLVISFRLH